MATIRNGLVSEEREEINLRENLCASVLTSDIEVATG